MVLKIFPYDSHYPKLSCSDVQVFYPLLHKVYSLGSLAVSMPVRQIVLLSGVYWASHDGNLAYRSWPGLLLPQTAVAFVASHGSLPSSELFQVFPLSEEDLASLSCLV